MDCQVKARWLGHPCVNPPAQQPFQFDHSRGSPIKDTLRDGGSNHHHIGPQEAETTTDVRGTRGLHHLSSRHLPQIMDLRATGVCYWWLPPCHPGLIDQMDPGIPNEGDSIERTELT